MKYDLNIDTILKLELSGSLAHFRKFYTNASSLTYSIPPRTALCGLFAAILMAPRDSYYAPMKSDKLHLAVVLPEGSSFKKQFFTMNYAGNEQIINDVSGHVQCRLELLMPANEKPLCWIIYLAYNSKADKHDSKINLQDLPERISKQNLGFEPYLGQRPFRASIRLLETYSRAEFSFLDSSDYLDSAIDRTSVLKLDSSQYQISMEHMPLEQALDIAGKKEYRRSVRFGSIIFENTGKRLIGEFKNLVQLNDSDKTRIAFL